MAYTTISLDLKPEKMVRKELVAGRNPEKISEHRSKGKPASNDESKDF